MERNRSLRRKTEAVVKKVIWPAIEGHSCPICLSELESRFREAAVLTRCHHAYCTDCIRRWSHVRRACPLCNSEFTSWFSILSLSSRTFRKHFLPFNSDANQPPPPLPSTRVVGRARVAVNNGRSRRNALPRRRSFGRGGLVSADVIAQRKLQWRASIYNQRLQPDSATLRCLEPGCKGCGPCNLLLSMGLNLLGNGTRKDAVKRDILQRIEPWIMRELQAILGDPDPTVIVHVATSQFITWLEEKAKSPSQHLHVGDSFIAPLRPFLHDEATIFWHELRYLTLLTLMVSEKYFSLLPPFLTSF
ncbi:hypothetical protein PIB30_027110 [Stylosanthes scabra]|uniref:RING-type E3 ubiquitin transferase n=1 Tax=Stylosanthes scabra TaxID=79078 RepID=A0ABU6W923_9FABA|nr:hypothetical protein [Stylosanthes scabra]